MIVVDQITKAFGETKALGGVSLEVKEGQVFGLLGPNGAGKTTLVRVLATLLTPDSGNVSIAGVDVVKQPMAVRTLIGLAGQSAAVDGVMTGRENLEMVGRLYRLSPAEAKRRADDALERLGLTDAADRLVRTYSGGMRRRIDLGASLVGRPKVLILDEPTTGLDPRTRQDLWGFLEELVDDGTTVLLTTQYLEEADRLANQIVVIDHGLIIAEGTSDELKDRLGGDLLEIGFAEGTDLVGTSQALQDIANGKIEINNHDRKLQVPVARGAVDLLATVRLMDEKKIEITDVLLRRPTLDDVFLSLTGHSTEEAVDEIPQGGKRRGKKASK